MSNPSLPAELLDQIVDHLHGSEDALESCCLISKSWVPRARKHLFARVEFHRISDIQSWERIFLDPSTSPACYTRTLIIGCPEELRAADVGKDCWIQTFSRITQLKIDVLSPSAEVLGVSLTPFYGLSPFIKSLRITSSRLLEETFDLACSFPLLEDLTVAVHFFCDPPRECRRLVATQPSSPPPFTGTLKLFGPLRIDDIASTLLSLPSGLHFRRLYLVGSYHDTSAWETALVEKCCDTLESIKIRHPSSNLVDLSKATKLKKIKFEIDQSPQHVAAVLRTITNNHQNLQRISISTNYTIMGREFADTSIARGNRLELQNANEAWLEFDRIVAQTWELRSTRIKVRYYSTVSADGEIVGSSMEDLLPELMMRGAVDFVERVFYWRGWML